MKNRRTFIVCLCFTLFLSISIGTDAVNGFPTPRPASHFAAAHLTLTWVLDPKTSQTITWTTDSSIQKGVVQYTNNANDTNFARKSFSSKATLQTLRTGSKKMHIFSVTLTGLQPGTKYLYRIGDGRTWSRTYSLLTEKNQPRSFDFLIFGDSQSNGDYHLWKQSIHSAYANNPNSRFFINVGDLVDRGNDYAQWDSWFKGSAGVIDTVPAMPVRGNHETNKSLWTMQFKLPQNGPKNGKDLTYSFDYGNVHFIILDNIEIKDTAILQEQKRWLENDLRSTQKPWKLVFFHKPIYFNKANHNNEYLKRVYRQILENYHTDVVFNGHDHAVARTYPMRNDKAAVKPAQGVIYYITGRSGSKFYIDSTVKNWDAFFYNPKDQPTYTVVNISGKTLNIKTFKLDGTLLDAVKIEKLQNP